MKKMIMLWLCAMLLVVAVGCASSTAGDDTVGGFGNVADEDREGQVGDDKTKEPQQTTEETKQPENTEAATEPAFDSSWAGNEFERQLEKPSFESWEVKEYVEGESWRMFVQDVHYDVAKGYANDLRSFGFVVNEEENDGYSGLAYTFEADNASGYHAKLVFEAGDRSGMGSFSLKISKN